MSDQKKMKTVYDGKYIRDELARVGYVVVPDVVSPEVCDTIKEKFFDYMKAMCPDFRPDDKTTWNKNNLPMRTKENLIQFNQAGEQEHAVVVRTEVKEVFEAIFPGKQLTCSFDCTSFQLRGEKPKYDDVEDWEANPKDGLHIDQTTKDEDEDYSVQSGVAIVDQTEDCRVFTVVPGSHLLHKEIMQLFKDERDDLVKQMKAGTLSPELVKKVKAFPKKIPLYFAAQWLVMNDKMKALWESKGLKQIRVPLKKGGMVLWKSNCVHASADFTKQCDPEAYRLQVFVCFAPRLPDGEAYKKEMAKRNAMWDAGATSKHSGRTLRRFAPNPHTYGRPLPNCLRVPSYPKKKMTVEQLKFHGLEPY
jgi:ectoine hydroxylase-related dioxygenase (phytanoyl-CoA dioxygenase family)